MRLVLYGNIFSSGVTIGWQEGNMRGFQAGREPSLQTLFLFIKNLISASLVMFLHIETGMAQSEGFALCL